MANAFYEPAREKHLGGDADWDLTHALMNIDEADDVPNLTTDDFYDDIAAGARVGTLTNLATPTKTLGVADADDTTMAAVTGDQFESFTILRNTGTESTSYVLVNFDTATGLPFTPSGGSITYVWDSGANKIFKL